MIRMWVGQMKGKACLCIWAVLSNRLGDPDRVKGRRKRIPNVQAQVFFSRSVFAADIRYWLQLLNAHSHQLFSGFWELSKYWTSE